MCVGGAEASALAGVDVVSGASSAPTSSNGSAMKAGVVQVLAVVMAGPVAVPTPKIAWARSRRA